MFSTEISQPPQEAAQYIPNLGFPFSAMLNLLNGGWCFGRRQLGSVSIPGGIAISPNGLFPAQRAKSSHLLRHPVDRRSQDIAFRGRGPDQLDTLRLDPPLVQQALEQ